MSLNEFFVSPKGLDWNIFLWINTDIVLSIF